MTDPLFSIILPVFNGEKTIERTIRGVLDQTYTNWELIIMDSESVDLTQLLIENFLSDSRIKYFRKKDDGIYDGMNKGIVEATGDWIYFTGSDDYFYTNSVLQHVYNSIKDHQELMVVYGKVKFQNSRLEYDRDFNLFRLSYKNICHQAIFYNRNLFQEIGYFNTDYKLYADWEFNLKWMDKYASKFVDQIIACYNENGVSAATDTMFLKNIQKIIKKELRKRTIKVKFHYMISKFFIK